MADAPLRWLLFRLLFPRMYGVSPERAHVDSGDGSLDPEIGDLRGSTSPLHGLTPNQRQELDKAQAVFSYYMYKHRGWISRRVDRWSYVGGSQWKCDISFDLSMLTFRAYYREKYLKLLPDDLADEIRRGVDDDWLMAGVAGSTTLDGVNDGDESRLLFNLPLTEISKEQQFTSFDLRDRNGRPLHLLTRSQAAMICYCMLVGAVEVEHDSNSIGGSKPLDCRPENDHLAYSLHQWFEHTSFPCDAVGEISPDDYDFHERIADAFCDVVDALADDNGEGNAWTDAEEVKQDFRTYYEKSEVFRYFIDEFAYKWVLFARIEFFDDAEIVKCSYTVPRDIAGDLLGQDGPVVRFELSNVGAAEHSRTIVEAPKGMRFAPSPAIEGKTKIGQASRAAFHNSEGKWFFIRDDVSAGRRVSPSFDCPDPSADSAVAKTMRNAPHIKARGTLTAEHATVETIDPWSADHMHRLRRLPVDGGVLHRYELWVSMRPQIGPRTIAQIVLAAVSLALYIMCIVDPSVYLKAENFSFNTILVVITAAFALVAVWDTPSYLRKRTTRVPLVATYAFVVLDVVAFAFYFAFRCFIQSSCCAACVDVFLPTVVTVAFMAIAAGLLIWELHWMYYNWWLPRMWDQGEKPYRVFDVDIVFYDRKTS